MVRFPDVLAKLARLEDQLRDLQFDIDQLWKGVGVEAEQSFRRTRALDEDDDLDDPDGA